MARSETAYRDYSSNKSFTGLDVDTPLEGYYRFKMRSGAVPVAVRVWFGAPLDPVTGEELDRSHRWQATVNDCYVELARVWPACGRSPIDRSEYDRLIATQHWASKYEPGSALADPSQKVDLMTAPILI